MDIFEKIPVRDKGNFFHRIVILLITLFLIIAIFFGVVICEKSIDENERAIKENVRSGCEAMYVLSEDMIDVVITQVKTITQFTELYSVFGEAVTDRYYYNTSAEIRSKLRNTVSMNPNIDSIYIYSKYRDEVITDEGTVLYESFNDKSWIDEYKNSKKTEFKTYIRNVSMDKSVLTFLYHVARENKDGVIVVNVDMSRYMSVIKNEGFSFIVQNDTKEILLGKKAKSYSDVAEKLILKEDGIFKVDGTYWGVAKIKSQFSNFSYFYVLPLESYKSDIVFTYVHIIFIILLFIVVFSLIAFKIAETTYKPIQEIGKILDDPYSEESRKYLSNDVNTKRIADKIFSVCVTDKNLYRELNEKMENLNYAQLSALQWQINPHFMFNTLNVLYLLTDDLAGRGNKASQSILSLSKLIRYSLKTEPMVVPLAEELEFVEEYIRIMAVRFEDSFSYEVIADESCMSKTVIKMCIQPILENAFRYGIKNLKRKGIIKVFIVEENDGLKIEISDNGYGISEDKLQNIREELKRLPKIAENHIGLLNVNSRLKLLYGNDNQLEIESEVDKGTKITFICPNKS